MSPVAIDVVTEPLQVGSPPSIINVTSWTSLPVEVRQMILSLVGLPVSRRRYNGLGSPKVAPFATVCSEWQIFFENWCIRKLWLRIQLSKYECPDCDEPEDETTQHCNNVIFTTCIQSLLGTLKLWDPVRHGAEGLELMLSASSPSDTEHRFNRCEIKDDYPYQHAEDLDLAPDLVDFYRTNIVDPFSRYFHRGYPPPLHSEHVKRVHGTPLRLELRRGERGRFISKHKSLPAVPMIKGLVIRRQFRRDIHVGTLSSLLGRSFVALEWFRFEKSVSPEPRKQVSFHRGFQLHLLPSLPRTLRQLSFTQWETPEIERGDGLEEAASVIPPHSQVYLPREMAKLSQRLEQFCPPWQMDTAAFLQSIVELKESPEMLEPPLKRLVLRCSLTSSDRSRQDFEALVILAARAALSLPQLEVIELWDTCLDGQESRAYIFRYSYEDGRASIIWRSCEETMVAQERIVAKWSEVAQKHSLSTLAYNAVPFAETKEDIWESDGTCIYQHLLLKDLVFDPITKMILENEPFERSLVENGDSSHQGDPLNSNLANLNSWAGDTMTDILASDADLASLRADALALNAKVNAFLQRHHG